MPLSILFDDKGCLLRSRSMKIRSLRECRYRAAKATGYKFKAQDFVELPPGKDAEEFVIAANVQRRHLSTEQKKVLVVQHLRRRPQEGDRKIALLLGVSNKPVCSA